MTNDLVKHASSRLDHVQEEHVKPTATPHALNEVDSARPPTAMHLELAHAIERMHRRYLDLLRMSLTRLGVNDVSPVQAVLMFRIGGDELSVRDLLDRGYYMGSNASYNLKQLVDAGYVERNVSPRDRRSARIRLSPKGEQLCDTLRTIHEGYHRLVVRNATEAQEMETACRLLNRIETVWTSALRHGEPSPVDAPAPANRPVSE